MPGRFLPKGSTVEWGRFRVPAKVKESLRGTTIFLPVPAVPDSEAFVAVCVVGSEIKASMRTKNSEYAEIRRASVLAHLKRYYVTVQSGPKSLSHKQLVGLGGKVYQKFQDDFSENPGRVNNWIAVKAWGRAVKEGRYDMPPELTIPAGPKREAELAKKIFGLDLTSGINRFPVGPSNKQAMEKRYGLLVNWVLQEEGILISAENREILLDIVHEAVTDASRQLKKNARFDYSPDQNAGKYPKFEAEKSRYTLDMLFEKWKQDGKTKGKKTVANTKKMVERLNAHAGYVDLSDITKSVAITWRDKLKTEVGLPTRSVNQYLTMMGALFNVAIRDELYQSTNPFKGIKFRNDGDARPNMNRYTDDEVRELLKISREQVDSSRRWLPWLAACTGARIGELAQMYKSNVFSEPGKIAYIELKDDPDDGRTKNPVSPRTIPLHPVIIEEGFLDFVQSAVEGPLFYTMGRKTENNAAFELVVGSMSHWIRKLGFKDPKKAPNHAFRLWWRTAASMTTASIEVRRYLFGHAQGSVEAHYNDFSVEQTYEEIQKIKIPVPD